jgi:hypothetical protein
LPAAPLPPQAPQAPQRPVPPLAPTPQQQPAYRDPTLIPMPHSGAPRKQLGGCGCLVLAVILCMVFAAAIGVVRSKSYMPERITPPNVIPVPYGGFTPPSTPDPRGSVNARLQKIDPDSFEGMFRIVSSEKRTTSFRTLRDDGRRADTTAIVLRVQALRDVDLSGVHFVVHEADDEDSTVPASVHPNPDGQPVDRWSNGQAGEIIICIDQYAYSTTTLFKLRLEHGNASYPRITALR